MNYFYIILLILVIYLMYSITEKYCNFRRNYANDIFAIRPPYRLAYDYNPDKLGPYRILKNNFLNFPIEGFVNNVEPFLPNIFKKSTYLESGLSKMTDSSQDYPPMTQDELHIRDMVNNLKLEKEIPYINKKIQKQGIFDTEKKDYQKDLQKYKFFDSEKCGEGYDYTGAYFITSDGVTCNNNNVNKKYRKCELKSIIEDGKIKKIDILDGGSGYHNPKIYIKSNDRSGIGCKLNVTAIDGNGSIKYIEVVDGGSGYINMPNINIIEKNNGCYLCVK